MQTTSMSRQTSQSAAQSQKSLSTNDIIDEIADLFTPSVDVVSQSAEQQSGCLLSILRRVRCRPHRYFPWLKLRKSVKCAGQTQREALRRTRPHNVCKDDHLTTRTSHHGAVYKSRSSDEKHGAKRVSKRDLCHLLRPDASVQKQLRSGSMSQRHRGHRFCKLLRPLCSAKWQKPACGDLCPAANRNNLFCVHESNERVK